MILPGMTVQGNMMECDACHRFMSTKSLQFGIKEDGEYQVTYFACPMCGHKFQILTTNGELRRMQAEYQEVREKIAQGRERRFRPKTMKKYTREARKIAEAMKERGDSLRETGDRILTGAKA